MNNKFEGVQVEFNQSFYNLASLPSSAIPNALSQLSGEPLGLWLAGESRDPALLALVPMLLLGLILAVGIVIVINVASLAICVTIGRG